MGGELTEVEKLKGVLKVPGGERGIEEGGGRNTEGDEPELLRIEGGDVDGIEVEGPRMEEKWGAGEGMYGMLEGEEREGNKPDFPISGRKFLEGVAHSTLKAII